MIRKKSQNIITTKQIIKKKSLININSNIKKQNTVKMNNLNKTITNYLYSNTNDNNKKKINIYKRQKTPINKKDDKEKNIMPLQKTRTFKYPQMNKSNDLYSSIDRGRNAINLKQLKVNPYGEYGDGGISKRNKEKKDVNKTVDDKLKHKAIITKRNKDNKTKIMNNKDKDKDKDKDKNNKKPTQGKIKNNKNNLKKVLNDEDTIIIRRLLRSKNSVDDISKRLFLKKTISSKNKIRKRILYTPKRKLKAKGKKILRTRTCPINFKKNVKNLLTSQYSESRFYTKTISPVQSNFFHKKLKKKNSLNNDEISYAFNNLKTNNSYNILENKPEEESENKENDNTINNIINNTININNDTANNTINNNDSNMISSITSNDKNKGGLILKLIKSNKDFRKHSIIHDFLYHNINSPLSLEIIISESKGIIYTKCPIGHLKKYKFYDFYNKFRAIPDLNLSLTCSICGKVNTLNNFFCGQCYNFLCCNCQGKHEYDFGHQVVSIHNINKFCSLHNKKYISFCYDCNKNCCEFCHAIQNKNHKIKTYKDILNDFQKEEKSISYIKNEIHNQLKILDEFILRYKDDLKTIENNELIEEYFEEYINYFKNLLKFKEKLVSKYSYNPNNFYNIMNVLNLSLPLFYNYKTEHLFKLSPCNELYEKYEKVNQIITFINNNSIQIFEGHQNFMKTNKNLNKLKIYRTIKPIKSIDINYTENKKMNQYNIINNDIYPKQILDLEYDGYFLLVKDKSFDIYDKDLNLIKIFNLTHKLGDTYKEILLGAQLLDNKDVSFYNYKKILIIRLSCDFLNYEIINEYDLKINSGKCFIEFNNFGYGDEEKNYNSFINKIIDINKNEILSFGIRFGEKYIASIWNKNKKYENQFIEISSDIKFSIYPIYSVLKYNETKFAILENNGNHYNIKIYEYKSTYTEQPYKDNIELNVNKNNHNNIHEKNESMFLEEINKNINKNKNYQNIKNDENCNETKELHNKGNRYENDSDDDSEEKIDKILEEIQINAQKREEEYLQSLKLQNNTNNNSNKKEKENEDIIINKNKEKQFKEIFNVKFIQFKTEDSTPEEMMQQIVLIKMNEKLFGYVDKDNIVIIDFEKCEILSKIDYGSNKLIYIDKTPSDNLLFKENNTIISYHLKDNNLTRINLPVFEYNKNDKNVLSWFLISGSNDFINKAKIIDNKFMISLFELRMEKWNLNQNINKKQN